MGKVYGAFRSTPIKNGASKTNLKKHCEASMDYAKEMQAKELEAYGYSYIEPQNTKYNKTLVACDCSYNEKVKELNQKYFGGKTIRKDGVTMLDNLFYYSPEKTPNLLCCFHQNNAAWKKDHQEWWDAYQAMGKEERQAKINEEYEWVLDWAEATKEWASKNLGIVVHCVLHFHEGTPHLDCKTVPIRYHEDEAKHVWAKREILGNKGHLSKMQTKYIEECGSKFGLERGEIHEEGAIREHASKVLHMAQKSKKDLEDEVKCLTEERDGLKGRVEALRGYVKKTNKVLMGVMQEDGKLDAGALWENAIKLYAEKNGLNATVLLRTIRQTTREEAHTLAEEGNKLLEGEERE